jgi:hypothetical protein
MAEHDESTVITRLRAQLQAVENYARRLEKAAECGISPEGWKDPYARPESGYAAAVGSRPSPPCPDSPPQT